MAFDYHELEAFLREMERLPDEIDLFCLEMSKEIAARLLRKVIKRTPVGDYSDNYDLEDDGENKYLVMSDKQGGTLRRGWTVGPIRKVGNDYRITVFNPVRYAEYVEYGHRQEPGRYVPAIGKKLKEPWAKGVFMLTISEHEIDGIAQRLVERRLEEKLKGVLNHD